MDGQDPDTSKSLVEVIGRHETLEFQWTIPNWVKVRAEESLLNSQMITFDSIQQTRWVVGLKAVPYQSTYRAQVYWKLLETNGPAKKLNVTVCTQLLTAEESIHSTDEKHAVLGQNEMIEETSEYLDVNTTKTVDEQFIHSDGSVKYLLKLIIMLPVSPLVDSIENYTKEFSEKSVKQLCKNQAGLLMDDSNADLQIITSDQSVIRAHKTILIAQCPVFASMLNTEFCEKTSGIVKLDDISEKTMKIILQYFYTGHLPPTWSDRDTLVEFVYAAGKYQMNLVLELLDSTLGRDNQKLTDFDFVDVQLLNLSEKLSLKNAETRLLQRVVEKVTNMKTSQDLFDLFGYNGEEINKIAEVFGSQSVVESRVLDILDSLVTYHDNNEQMNGLGKMGIQVLAVMQCQNEKGTTKILEKILLERFGAIVSNIKTAVELFAFFGHVNN